MHTPSNIMVQNSYGESGVRSRNQ